MKLAVGIVVVSATAVLTAASFAGEGKNIAFLPKAVNNPYFDIAAKGGKEAAGKLGGSFRQVGPSQATAAGQVTWITTLTQQRVDAIVLSANDPNALVPALERASSAGIKIVTYDSDVKPSARQIFVNQARTEEIGRIEVKELGRQLKYEGEIAILSASSTATNQNTWIKWMKAELKLPKYKNMKLVKVAYGNDDDQVSYNQTLALLQAYPDLKGIISPTTVGIAAAARALVAKDMSGKVALTGLGTPNQLRSYVKKGTIKGFALWDPSALGYLAYQVAYQLADGTIEGKAGETVKAGKLGTRKIEKGGVIVLGPPTVFTKANIDKFKF